tara:strand:- start:1417 stop:2031 length:615 start_codon:yes stop_codon:yes gene_type:complete
MTLLYPTYFPNIATYVVMTQSKDAVFETHDSYQKQTYRNRCYIYGANGKLSLNIPVHYSQKNRQNTEEIRIDNSSKWQSIHWKSIESAYKTSPFFEFYENEFTKLFNTPKEFLLDFNLECIAVINQCLGLEMAISKSNQFTKTTSEADYRFLVNARKEAKIEVSAYIQVFQDKHGFISNLSILDLLFNEGPNASNYLNNHPIDF